MGELVRVFVAATPVEWLPARILEFSIRETTKRLVEVTPIYTAGRVIHLPQAIENRPRTPFSFQRFLIPELCQYQGRAVYLDADMQVFSDVADLWSQPMQAHDLLTVREDGHGRQGQFSVMLLDCKQLKWRIEDIVQGLDAGDFTYEQLLHQMCVARSVGRTVDTGWNSLESYDRAITHLLHYTDMHTQPWVSTRNPLAHLWVGCLRRAVTDGFITRSELEREVAAGHVRPTLLAQIDAGVDDPRTLSTRVRQMDRTFIPPYLRLAGRRRRQWMSLAAIVRALKRRLFRL